MGAFVGIRDSRGIGTKICRVAAVDGWPAAVRFSFSPIEAERAVVEAGTAASASMAVLSLFLGTGLSLPIEGMIHG